MKIENELTSRLRTDRKWALESLKNAQERIEEIDKELARRKASGQLAAERRVTSRQIGGDDGYHHCVLVDGSVKWNGLTRREVQHYKSIEVKRLLGQS